MKLCSPWAGQRVAALRVALAAEQALSAKKRAIETTRILMENALSGFFGQCRSVVHPSIRDFRLGPRVRLGLRCRPVQTHRIGKFKRYLDRQARGGCGAAPMPPVCLFADSPNLTARVSALSNTPARPLAALAAHDEPPDSKEHPADSSERSRSQLEHVRASCSDAPASRLSLRRAQDRDN